MKKAEEWIKETDYESARYSASDGRMIQYVKQILLEGIKEGMTRAANELLSCAKEYKCDRCNYSRFIANKILTDRDNLKEL